MTERLQRALEHLDELSPELQDQLAELIEQHISPALVPSETLAGAWSDLPDTFDEMLDALDRLRHASPPTPAIAEQLAWMDTEERP